MQMIYQLKHPALYTPVRRVISPALKPTSLTGRSPAVSSTANDIMRTTRPNQSLPFWGKGFRQWGTFHYICVTSLILCHTTWKHFKLKILVKWNSIYTNITFTLILILHLIFSYYRTGIFNLTDNPLTANIKTFVKDEFIFKVMLFSMIWQFPKWKNLKWYGQQSVIFWVVILYLNYNLSFFLSLK